MRTLITGDYRMRKTVVGARTIASPVLQQIVLSTALVRALFMFLDMYHGGGCCGPSLPTSSLSKVSPGRRLPPTLNPALETAFFSMHMAGYPSSHCSSALFLPKV